VPDLILYVSIRLGYVLGLLNKVLVLFRRLILPLTLLGLDYGLELLDGSLDTEFVPQVDQLLGVIATEVVYGVLGEHVFLGDFF
jgi:hypothetical protein